MTDKKYTDEEIEKALSLCGRTTEVVYCDQCPLCGEYECNREIKVLALDIINHQKETIETLRKCVEQHHIIRKDSKSPLSLLTEEIRAEAYKEFADMVKKNIKEVWNYDNGTCSCVLVLTKDIDNLLKEMVGE